MKNNFEAMHSEPTPTEQCKGFSILNYRDISNTKSSRLSTIDSSLASEPYIVEVLTKLHNAVNCKVSTFTNIESALAFQNAI